MTIVRCAIINQSTNSVDNVLMVNPATFSLLGHTAVASSTANIGDLWNGTAFSKPAPTAPQLAAYAQAKQTSIMTGGISVNVGTVSVPQVVEAETDPASLVLLQGAYTLAQASSTWTTTWVQASGVSTPLTAAQVITIFNAVTSFLQSTFSTLATVLTGIQGGTITTTAQVDSAAWPANS